MPPAVQEEPPAALAFSAAGAPPAVQEEPPAVTPDWEHALGGGLVGTAGGGGLALSGGGFVLIRDVAPNGGNSSPAVQEEPPATELPLPPATAAGGGAGGVAAVTRLGGGAFDGNFGKVGACGPLAIVGVALGAPGPAARRGGTAAPPFGYGTKFA